MELLVTFLFALALIACLLWVLSRGRSPAYRPSRKTVAKLLEGVLGKTTTGDQWNLFIGLPIVHDPGLEKIRRRCQVLSEGDDEHPAYPSGIGGYLFSREGRERIAVILKDLEKLIASEPFIRGF